MVHLTCSFLPMLLPLTPTLVLLLWVHHIPNLAVHYNKSHVHLLGTCSETQQRTFIICQKQALALWQWILYLVCCIAFHSDKCCGWK